MISIIIPVHNGREYLEKCIDSIINNTYKNIEILLVENASTDDTLQLCYQLKEKYNCIDVISTPKAGLSHARNMGLDRAKGEWIAFVDADDYVSPYMYEKMVNGISDEVDLVFCDCFMGSEQNYPFTREDKDFVTLSKDEFYHDTYMKNQTIYSVVWNKLFRRSCLSNLRFDESLSYIEDRNFVVQYVAKSRSVVFLPEALYYYWRGNTNSICYVADQRLRMDQIYSGLKDLSFFETNYPDHKNWQEYVSACVLQNADFRKKRAIETGFEDIEKELSPIIIDMTKRVRLARYISNKKKLRFLLEHYSPTLFSLVYKLHIARTNGRFCGAKRP